MTNLGEIEGLAFEREQRVVNHAMPGNTELMCIYKSQTGHIVQLPRAAFNTSPPLKEVPPKNISVLIRIAD